MKIICPRCINAKYTQHMKLGTNNVLTFKADNRVTYFGYFVPVFGQNGRESCSLLSHYSTIFPGICENTLRKMSNIEVFMLCALIFYATTSKDVLSLLEVVWKITACLETALRLWIFTKTDEVLRFTV